MNIVPVPTPWKQSRESKFQWHFSKDWKDNLKFLESTEKSSNSWSNLESKEGNQNNQDRLYSLSTLMNSRSHNLMMDRPREEKKEQSYQHSLLLTFNLPEEVPPHPHCHESCFSTGIGTWSQVTKVLNSLKREQNKSPSLQCFLPCILVTAIWKREMAKLHKC